MHDGQAPSFDRRQQPNQRHWRGFAAAILALLEGGVVTACAPGEPLAAAATPTRPLGASSEGPTRAAHPVTGHVVAIGDLHADIPAMLTALRVAGVVDAEGHWSGGDITLVQTGDMMDRGDASFGLIKLLRQLAVQAEAAGGKVICLLGNHEAMNLTGDWRYVSPSDLTESGGTTARQAALLPTGDPGAWLRSLDSAIMLGDTVFVHGGLRPQWAALGVQGVSAAVRAALAGRAPPTILGAEGPLWYRGYLMAPEPLACAELTQALGALAARRMVIGHTTQFSGKIASRCGGQLLGIDTGVSTYYGHHSAVLDLINGDARAVYASSTEDLPDP